MHAQGIFLDHLGFAPDAGERGLDLFSKWVISSRLAETRACSVSISAMMASCVACESNFPILVPEALVKCLDAGIVSVSRVFRDVEGETDLDILW